MRVMREICTPCNFMCIAAMHIIQVSITRIIISTPLSISIALSIMGMIIFNIMPPIIMIRIIMIRITVCHSMMRTRILITGPLRKDRLQKRSLPQQTKTPRATVTFTWFCLNWNSRGPCSLLRQLL